MQPDRLVISLFPQQRDEPLAFAEAVDADEMGAFWEGREGGEIDALNRRQVVAYARLATAESAALAKIFALLNPDQKARATTMLARIGSILQIRPSPPQSTYRRPYASAEKRHVI